MGKSAFDFTIWLATIVGGTTLTIALLYFIGRGIWLCIWDTYVTAPLIEKERLNRSARLTGSYYYQNHSDAENGISTM